MSDFITIFHKKSWCPSTFWHPVCDCLCNPIRHEWGAIGSDWVQSHGTKSAAPIHENHLPSWVWQHISFFTMSSSKNLLWAIQVFFFQIFMALFQEERLYYFSSTTCCSRLLNEFIQGGLEREESNHRQSWKLFHSSLAMVAQFQ